MRLFSTRTHGMLDYLFGVLLVTLPWLLMAGNGGPAVWVPTLAGAVTIGYSIITDYEYGLVRRLGMPVHLWLDALVGTVLVISPWLWGFDQQIWAPHVVAGIVALVAALSTSTIPGYERRRAR